jgi:nicotinate-nucleotide adenylyltransferase
MKRAIGILGGTFDPIHNGHLQPALEAMSALQLAELRLMPNHIPPHRPQPVASSAQRLAMVQLAAAELPGVCVDDRELRRHTPSYTIDTLIELRQERPDTPLCFLIGMDSLLGLPGWHRWQELTDYAHLIVSVRPGWHPELSAELAAFVTAHRAPSAQAVHQQLAGYVVWMQNQPIALSATELRSQLAQDEPPVGLLPQKVADYIRQQGIYRPTVL